MSEGRAGRDNVVIIGPGRMGLALGAALRHEHAVGALTYFGRGIEPPPHPLFDAASAAADAADARLRERDHFDTEDDVPTGAAYAMLPARPPEATTIVILAVPDDALPEVVHDLAAMGVAPPGCAVLHLSGALSTDVLTPLHHRDYAIGSMHPLMAVADPWLAGYRLVGAAFAITGEPAASVAARRIVSALGGTPLSIPSSQRPLYHAAAVVASNYLVALMGASIRMLGGAGVDEDDAVRALLPLLRGTLDNIEQLGVRAAVTGPIARGDVDTVRLHLARLSGEDRMLYSSLGLEMLRLARSAGLDEERSAEIESLLTSG